MYSLFFFIFRLKEKDVIVQKMHTVESDYKSQVSKLESDLEDQRAKNNVSRHCNTFNLIMSGEMTLSITVIVLSNTAIGVLTIQHFEMHFFQYRNFVKDFD